MTPAAVMMMMVVVVVVVGVASGGSVVRMTRDDGLVSVDKRLLHHLLMHKQGVKSSRLSAFQFTNCGDPNTEEVVVTQLSVTPDPVPTSGTLTITAKAQGKKEVTAPVKTTLTIKKKVLGLWVTVPCVDNFGSCNYDDFCVILAEIQTCPQPFVDNGVPCKCPIPVGNYTLPGIPLEVELPSILPTGDYSIKIDMNATDGPVGCYEVNFTVA